MGVIARLYEAIVFQASRLDELRQRGLQSWVEEIAALHLLQVQAQALIDMVKRIASELGHIPSSGAEALEILVAEGVLSPDEASFVRRVIGFHNIVVHEYLGVDMGLVRRIVESGEYRRVVALAAELLRMAEERGLDP